MKYIFKNSLIIIFLFSGICHAQIKIINIAVASNFLSTLNVIVENFEKEHDCKVIISSDSTSNLYTKIKNGAPFDIFMSADVNHALLLETENNKSKVYAYGKIALWQKDKKIKKNLMIFFSSFNLISTANSKLSPYGKSSKIFYKNINIEIKSFVYGSNINQAFKFICLGNSEIGIIALSQTMHKDVKKENIWKVPQYLYPKIEQRIIMLNNNKDNDIKHDFINYLNEKRVQNLIQKYGYKVN